MKSIHKLAAVAILALSSVGIASAQTYHVTGSTAFRNSVVDAEVVLCGSNTSSPAYAIFWGTSSKGVTGANYSIIANSNSTSASLIFENYWSGSIAGDSALVANSTIAFPKLTSGNVTSMAAITTAPSYSTGVNAGPGGYGGSSSNPGGDSTTADIAMSDVSFDTAQQILKNEVPPNNNTLASATYGSSTIGIVPFVFVANATSDFKGELGTSGLSPSTVSLSIDPQTFNYIWQSQGATPLSFLTGNSADVTAKIFALGRDADSGTRAGALAETGYGLGGSGIISTPVSQFYPYDNDTHYQSDESTAEADPTGVAGFGATAGVVGDDSSATSIGELELVPYESVDAYEGPGQGTDGDGGYNSGGNLATAMSAPFNGPTATVLVAYLGASDAKTALTGGAVLLAYNGAVWYPSTPGGSFTSGDTGTNSAQIYYGKYTYWGYEHLFYKKTISTEASAIVTELSTDKLDELSSNNVLITNMHAQRSDDGLGVSSK